MRVCGYSNPGRNILRLTRAVEKNYRLQLIKMSSR